MVVSIFKNFLLLMSLAFFAYHLDSFAQVNQRPQNENFNQLLFLTENENAGVNINYIDSGRSLLYSKELSSTPVLPGSIHWSSQDQGQKKLLTYAQKLEDGSIDLKISVITPAPLFSVKTSSLPQILKDEFNFKQWVAKAPNQFFATTGTAIYYVTIGTRPQTKATLVHKSSSITSDDVDIMDFDVSGKNLIFSYNTSAVYGKTYYILNLETHKIVPLKGSAACKGKIIHLKNHLIPMGENQFLTYCSSTATTEAAFLFWDFSKLTVTRYETKEDLDQNSNFTIDSFGYFILIKNVKDRVMYCTGNIKEKFSMRCFNTTSLNSGFIFSGGNPFQFFMIAPRNIFSIDFPTGISRRTSILFNEQLTGTVLAPVSL